MTRPPIPYSIQKNKKQPMKREHILIIRFSAIGDVAMAVPVVYSLAMTYPDLRITVLSRAYARPFFEDLAPNISFMEADLKHEYHGIKGLNALYRRLTAKNFTSIADFHSVLRSEYLCMRFNMGLYHVAHIDKHRAGRRMITAPTPKKQLVQQPTSFEKYADVLARLGYPVKLQFRSLFPEEGGNLNMLPAIVSVKNREERWIGIAPFAAHESKIYPLELMEQVIHQLESTHPEARFFFFGRGKREDELFPEWCRRYPEGMYVGQHLENMQQELILMSHLDVMISMDSSNMHLASLTNTPVISIWGATHPFAGFMGWNQDPANVIQVSLPCRPCSIYGQKKCLRGDYACLRQIQPQTITDRVEAILHHI